MTFKRKEEILTKPVYCHSDVKELSEVGDTRAWEIMKECRANYGGALKNNDRGIKAESYWLWQGTTLAEELRKVGIALYGV